MEGGAVTGESKCTVRKSVDVHRMGKVGRNMSMCLRLVSVSENTGEGFPGFIQNQPIFFFSRYWAVVLAQWPP